MFETKEITIIVRLYHGFLLKAASEKSDDITNNTRELFGNNFAPVRLNLHFLKVRLPGGTIRFHVSNHPENQNLSRLDRDFNFDFPDAVALSSSHPSS